MVYTTFSVTWSHALTIAPERPSGHAAAADAGWILSFTKSAIIDPAHPGLSPQHDDHPGQINAAAPDQVLPLPRNCVVEHVTDDVRCAFYRLGYIQPPRCDLWCSTEHLAAFLQREIALIIGAHKYTDVRQIITDALLCFYLTAPHA